MCIRYVQNRGPVLLHPKDFFKNIIWLAEMFGAKWLKRLKLCVYIVFSYLYIMSDWLASLRDTDHYTQPKMMSHVGTFW